MKLKTAKHILIAMFVITLAVMIAVYAADRIAKYIL